MKRGIVTQLNESCLVAASKGALSANGAHVSVSMLEQCKEIVQQGLRGYRCTAKGRFCKAEFLMRLSRASTPESRSRTRKRQRARKKERKRERERERERATESERGRVERRYRVRTKKITTFRNPAEKLLYDDNSHKHRDSSAPCCRTCSPAIL